MTLRALDQPRRLLSSLLIAGAALFAIGVAAERNAADGHTETGTEAAHTEGTTQTEESGGQETPHTEEQATEPVERSSAFLRTTVLITKPRLTRCWSGDVRPILLVVSRAHSRRT